MVEIGGEGNLLPQPPTQQPAERQPGGLAHEIPASELQPGNGAMAAFSIIERDEGCLGQDALEIEGVFAQEHGGDLGFDQRLGDLAAQGLPETH